MWFRAVLRWNLRQLVTLSAMTRFYFHLRDSREYMEDTEGVELPDLHRAIEEAELAAREMMSEMVLRGEAIDGEIFEIADSTGVILARVQWKRSIKFED